MDHTVQQQPQAQAPMTTDIPQNKGEGNGAKQVKFGTARYNFYPSTGASSSTQPGAGAGCCSNSSTGCKQASAAAKPEPLPALPQPARLAGPPQGSESGTGNGGQGPPCVRGGATGNCCTEPFGCCYHWAKNICGDGTN